MVKFVFCAFLIFVASAAPAEKSGQTPSLRVDEHNLVRCDPEASENWKILNSETVLAKRRLFRTVERTIKFPKYGMGKEVITCIRITDLVGDGTGGFPYIIQNGVGFQDVTIKLVSQRSRGFQFSVDIYGQ